MSIRASSWSITINNPNQSDEECINRARQIGYKIEGQLEKGVNGTPHYQLMVKTPQIRFSAMKKAFPRAHIEVARNPDALEAYVNKEDTRIGQLVETNDMYPSLSKLWDLFHTYYKTEYAVGIPSSHITRNEEQRLEIFDAFVGVYIGNGYHIETMAVNPQIRGCVKKFINNIFLRVEKNLRRQTDRQTDKTMDVEDEKLSCDKDITDASSCSSYKTEASSSSISTFTSQSSGSSF